MQSQMRQMRNKYTSKGIPVLMGEFGTLWRTMPADESQEKHDASIYSWYYTLCRHAVNNGVIPFVWDTNACQRPSMDIINRKTLTIFNQQALDGILKGCASVKWPGTSGVEDIHFIPEKDSSSFTSHPSIHDLMGRPLTNTPSRGIYITNGKKYVR